MTAVFERDSNQGFEVGLAAGKKKGILKATRKVILGGDTLIRKTKGIIKGKLADGFTLSSSPRTAVSP